MATERPNLLFLMTDHQRADSIGMLQAGIDVTPNLNRLASQSALFTRAYNTCPLCVPARTALATGKYPTHNGVVYNDWRGLRAGDHVTLHQLLAEAGYAVGHIGVDHIRVSPELRERVSFAAWAGNAEYDAYLAQHGTAGGDEPGWASAFRREVHELQDGDYVPQQYSNTATSDWPGRADLFKDSCFCAQGIEFLRQQRRPFALFLYLWAPHPPLRVPEPYASLFPPQALDLPPNVGLPALDEPPGRRRGIAAQLAEGLETDTWRKVWAAHLGLVRLADDGLGRVLDVLEQLGLNESTVTLFTVDHGDHLGQHRMYQKMEMYEQAIRIPLIIRAPGAKASVWQEPVSHLDVLPTLADLLDLPKADAVDGASLADTVAGGARPRERPQFCQYSGNPTVGDIRRTVIRGHFKYTYTPGDIPELYDLDNDPLETENLGRRPEHRGLVADLHNTLAAWGMSHGDWVEF